MLAQAGQIDEAVDGTQQMIGRYVLLKAEVVEERLRITMRSPIIDSSPVSSTK
jgi:hypothetical protein